VNRDQLAAGLLATFLAELEEQVRAMNADLLALEAEPADAERLKSLFRVVHTLKGAARAVAVAPIEHACHALETLLAEARDRKRSLGPEELALLFSAAGALMEAGQRLKTGRDLAGSPLTSLGGRLKAARPGAGGRSGRRHGGEADA
jgi:two-component system chemotaxis sensor kinase CheA